MRHRILGFQAFIALDTLGVVVLGFAFFPGQLDAVDATVLQVDVVHVINETAVPGGTVGGVRADPVAGQRDELLVGLRQRLADRSQQRASGHGGQRELFDQFQDMSPLYSLNSYSTRPTTR